MPLTVGKPKEGVRSRQRVAVEPEYYEMDIPSRKVRIGPEIRALIDMPVDKTAMMFFQKPEGMEYERFSGRMGSHIAAARRHCPGSSYVKRMVEIEDKLGIGVWRVK